MEKFNKVVVLDSVIFYPEHRARLDKIANEVIEYNTCHTEEEVIERIDGADCVISCWVDVTKKVLEMNPQLKTVAFWTHAYEHRIDKSFAEKNGIHVPCIPDYGTDSVAELAVGGLAQLYSSDTVNQNTIAGKHENVVGELVLSEVFNQVRMFKKNMRNNLRGTWVHENIKTGKKKITSPDEIPEQTLKGLTIGILSNTEKNQYIEDMIKIFRNGFRMNILYANCDLPHHLDLAYRTFDKLLQESNVLIYDSRRVTENDIKKIEESNCLAKVDLAEIYEKVSIPIRKRKLGIVGLGRIGSRVAQIAVEGFDMEVVYYSKTRKTDVEAKLGINYLSLEEVLTKSDIISFHLPHVGAEDFITKDMIEMIPSGTTVINVSVGNIIDDQTHFLSRFSEDDLIGFIDVYKSLPPRQLLRSQKEYLLSTYRAGWRTSATIGLKTHKLLSRLEDGLNLTD